MTFLETWRSPTVPAFDAEKVLRLQVGAFSPLWLPVCAAAMTGVAVWSMTRWMRLATPEGVSETAAPAQDLPAVLEPEPIEAPAIAAPVAPAPVALAADLEPEAAPPKPKAAKAVAPAIAKAKAPVRKARPTAH